MKKYIVSILLGAFVCNAYAAVKIKNSTAMRYAQQNEEQNAEFDGDDDPNDIATLENDIRVLDEEIAKCKKQKKGWIAATVVGSAGTVATGVAAAVQGIKIRDQKDELRPLLTTKNELDKKNTALGVEIKQTEEEIEKLRK